MPRKPNVLYKTNADGAEVPLDDTPRKIHAPPGFRAKGHLPVIPVPEKGDRFFPPNFPALKMGMPNLAERIQKVLDEALVTLTALKGAGKLSLDQEDEQRVARKMLDWSPSETFGDLKMPVEAIECFVVNQAGQAVPGRIVGICAQSGLDVDGNLLKCKSPGRCHYKVQTYAGESVGAYLPEEVVEPGN